MLKKLLTTLFASFITFSAFAVGPAATNPKKWHVVIAPYGWVFGMNGSMTVKDNEADLNFKPIDVLKNLSKVDSIFQIHLEAGVDKWALMFDSTYLKVSTDVSVNVPLPLPPFFGRRTITLGGTITPSIFLSDFGAFYSVAQKSASKFFGNVLDLQAFVGGRYLNMKGRITPLRLPQVEEQQSFLAPIVGGRLFYNISKKYQLILLGNVGGFGVDDARFTWTASLLANIFFKEYFALAFGVRVEGFDYQRGSGADRFALDSTFYGPIIGLVFKI